MTYLNGPSTTFLFLICHFYFKVRRKCRWHQCLNTWRSRRSFILKWSNLQRWLGIPYLNWYIRRNVARSESYHITFVIWILSTAVKMKLCTVCLCLRVALSTLAGIIFVVTKFIYFLFSHLSIGDMQRKIKLREQCCVLFKIHSKLCS